MSNLAKTQQLFDKISFLSVLLFCATSVFTIAGNQISLGLATLAWLTCVVFSRGSSLKKTGLEWPVLTFVLVCILATVFSVRPQQSFINMKNLFLMLTFFVMAHVLTTQKRLLLAVDVFVGFATLFSIIGIVFYLIDLTRKSMATQSTSMTWGAMSVFFVTVTVAVAVFGENGRRRLLYATAALPQLVSLMFSYVRGAYVGLVSGLLLLAWLRNKRLMLILLAGPVVIGLLMPSPVKERALSIFDANSSSTQVRLHQWRDSIEMFKDRPILGFGWVDLGDIHRSYAPTDADLTTDEYTIGHFHNNFVMVVMSFGILGLIAFIWLLARFYVVEYRAWTSIEQPTLAAVTLGAMAGFVGFVANGMFDWLFGDAEVVTILWLTLGFVIAAKRITV